MKKKEKKSKAGSAKDERRVAARTKASEPTVPAPAPEPPHEIEDGPDVLEEADGDLAEVIPLGLFNPLEDPWGRS